MATVTITVPTAVVPRVRTAIVSYWTNMPYPTAEFATNPTTGMNDTQLFQFTVAQYVRGLVRAAEAASASAAADATAKTDMAGIA